MSLGHREQLPAERRAYTRERGGRAPRRAIIAVAGLSQGQRAGLAGLNLERRLRAVEERDGAAVLQEDLEAIERFVDVEGPLRVVAKLHLDRARAKGATQGGDAKARDA